MENNATIEIKKLIEKYFSKQNEDFVIPDEFINECKPYLKSGLENFHKNSFVSEFFAKNSRNIKDSLILDYDGRTYIRIMKLFHQNNETMMDYTGCNYCTDAGIDPVNMPFHLRYYIPKSTIGAVGKKNDKVVIMINGMNELEHYHLYDMLGEFFANNNIAAVLLPTPLHLNRRITENGEMHSVKTPIKPTVIANKENHQLFYLNYIKGYLELNHLIEKIRGNRPDEDEENDFNFYDNYFGEKNTQITLLGYSLGGLKTLGYFLNDFESHRKIDYNKKITVDDFEDLDEYLFKHKEQKLHCCITINSGPNLLGVTADEKIMGMNPEKWLSLIEGVSSKLKEEKSLNQRVKCEISIDKINALMDYFKYLYFVNSRQEDTFATEKGQAKLEDILDNYLAISGGADQLVNVKAIQEMRRKKNNENPIAINQLIVAKGDHHPSREDSYWHEMLPVAEHSILDFINSCGEKHYTKKAILDILESLILTSNNHTEIIKKCKETFHRDDFTHLLNGFPETPNGKKNKLLLKKYYFKSKAFYPNFPDVLDEIRKRLPAN